MAVNVKTNLPEVKKGHAYDARMSSSLLAPPCLLARRSIDSPQETGVAWLLLQVGYITRQYHDTLF